MKKITSKLLIFILFLSFFIIPFNVLAYSQKVYVGGENIGIEVNSKGVLIVGFYPVNGTSPGRDAKLEVGDIIIGIDDTDISKISDLSKVIKENSKNLKITYLRNNNKYSTNLTLYKDNNNVIKTGLYVKDKIVGIGTLTFVDPNTKTFAALGHEIAEKTTGRKFEISGGKIYSSSVTSIESSSRNSVGEKNATFDTKEIGKITTNDISGIYGKYTKEINEDKLISIAKPKLGKATFKTVVDKDKIEEFTINIIKINEVTSTKNILFEVTDKKLLNTTNGIVQGMSGSPIIQDNNLVGAITHVVLDDPHKGYGIFITNMLEMIKD